MVIRFSDTNQKLTTKDTKITKETLAYFVSFVRFVVRQGCRVARGWPPGEFSGVS